jgi:hypothetical protein
MMRRQSYATISARPTAATTMSALPTTLSMFLVREWAIVTFIDHETTQQKLRQT